MVLRVLEPSTCNLFSLGDVTSKCSSDSIPWSTLNNRNIGALMRKKMSLTSLKRNFMNVLCSDAYLGTGAFCVDSRRTKL